jgi:hypothetical protein
MLTILMTCLLEFKVVFRCQNSEKKFNIPMTASEFELFSVIRFSHPKMYRIVNTFESYEFDLSQLMLII